MFGPALVIDWGILRFRIKGHTTLQKLPTSIPITMTEKKFYSETINNLRAYQLIITKREGLRELSKRFTIKPKVTWRQTINSGISRLRQTIYRQRTNQASEEQHAEEIELQEL